VSLCSLNWSGYAVPSANYSVSAVYGSWVVPRVNCQEPATGFVAVWVGIDGFSSNTVEQVGVGSDCLEGSPIYYAWYEFYPNPSVLINSVNVAPGDLIKASVTYSAHTDDFTTSISSSGGGSNVTSQQVPGAWRSSAEWIVERPAICFFVCIITPLGDFGTAGLGSSFTESKGSNYATVGGSTEPIGSFLYVALTMTDEFSNVVALPSPLTADGTSFLASVSGTFVWVGCTPTSAVVGSKVVCRATVMGSKVVCRATVMGDSPTGTVVWSGNGSGRFSPPACKLLNGACAVKYILTSAGSPPAVVATYRGDGRNPSSFGTFGVGVNRMVSRTAVACTTASPVVGQSSRIKCTVKVTGDRPAGYVDWTQSGAGSVAFITSRCALVKGLCSVTMTTVSAGKVTIQAAYQGSENNVPSSAGVKLAVKQARTSLSIYCASSTVGVGLSVKCTATLKGHVGPPVGLTVTWSTVGGREGVVFSSPACTLSSKGACSVVVTGIAVGRIGVTAAYGGDQNNAGASKTVSLKVT
jgi:hypothetical protein